MRVNRRTPKVDGRVMKILRDYFYKDPHKIASWLNTPNQNLGGVSPNEMAAAGKTEQLVQWVRDSYCDNKEQNHE